MVWLRVRGEVGNGDLSAEMVPVGGWKDWYAAGRWSPGDLGVMIGRFCVACDTDPYKFDGVFDLFPTPPGCTLVISGGRDAMDDGGESN
jgi:hypothetical protein